MITTTTVSGKPGQAPIDPATYRQIVEAGVGGGGITAATLLLQQPDTIKQIASLQGQLATQATTLGNTSASQMYNAGIQSADGLLKGLQSSSTKLTNQMENLADSLVTTLKKKLGIKSPSTVFYGHGQNIAQGLINGIAAKQGDVDTAIARMTSTGVLMSAVPRTTVSPSAPTGTAPGGTFVGTLTLDSGAFLGQVKGVIKREDNVKAVRAVGGAR